MIKNRNNGPLFIAPRDEYGNKKIWNEDKQEYVVNEALYAIPLKFAPRDANGQKMEWNTDRLVYESKTTGQVFSTILMDFVDQKNNRDAVDFMEDAALDNNIIDEDEFLEVERIPLKKAVEMVLNNEIPDSKTQVGILKAAFLVENGRL